MNEESWWGKLIINGYKPNNPGNFSSKKKLGDKSISFTAEPPKYKVINTNLFKRAIPAIAFSASLISALGYLLGGTGLFYDLYKDKQQNKLNKIKEHEEGVKTIVANTELGKAGMTCTKIGITAAAVGNIACGIGEGLPLMALGEASNLGAASIIETPIGTGLFGIGIASIFAGLALDNTPELKLNEYDVMAKEGFNDKATLVLKNMKVAAKEIGSSVVEIIKGSIDPEFWKKNILRITPKTVVFSESINKDGKVILSKALRHNKNYLMHAASFVLGIGGTGIIAATLLDQKKAQKASLITEETGFLFDNFGITKYGLDRLTTGNKSSGTSFAVGGVMNAISQFIGLDNKDGRALQWLGIGGVFLGYTIDRGKHLKTKLKDALEMPQLTKIVREWKFDLSELVKDKTELKKLLMDIKTEKPITNEKFIKLENAVKSAVGDGDIKPTTQVESSLGNSVEKGVFGNIKPLFEKNFEETKKTLKICSEKIFGKDPQLVEKAKK